MRIGAHESIAGGLHLALSRGERDGCEALQIFTGFNTRWAARRFEEEEASMFRSEAARLGYPLLSHASYLINLASPDAGLWRRSIDALVDELVRCETLGVHFVVLHPGAHMGRGERWGVRRVGRALSQVHRRTSGFTVRILLENTAGQGSCLADRFAHLGQIINETAGAGRLGVCIDTCHGFAAGYNLRDPRGYASAFEELEQEVGIAALLGFHLNDSKAPLGSRRDRHASIGEGLLGEPAFERLVNDQRFATLPAVVETPAEPDGTPSFAKNIRRLKELRRDGAENG